MSRKLRETSKPFSDGWKNPPLYKGRLVGDCGKIFKPPQPLLIKEGSELFTEGLRNIIDSGFSCVSCVRTWRDQLWPKVRLPNTALRGRRKKLRHSARSWKQALPGSYEDQCSSASVRRSCRYRLRQCPMGKTTNSSPPIRAMISEFR